jgi:hypothetical protein
MTQVVGFQPSKQGHAALAKHQTLSDAMLHIYFFFTPIHGKIPGTRHLPFDLTHPSHRSAPSASSSSRRRPSAVCRLSVSSCVRILADLASSLTMKTRCFPSALTLLNVTSCMVWSDFFPLPLTSVPSRRRCAKWLHSGVCPAGCATRRGGAKRWRASMG